MATAREWLVPMDQGGRNRMKAAADTLARGNSVDETAAALWAASGAELSLADAQSLGRAYRSWRTSARASPTGFRETSIVLIADETTTFLAEGLFAGGLRHGLLISARSIRLDEAVAATRQGKPDLLSADVAVLLAPQSATADQASGERVLEDIRAIAGAWRKAGSGRLVLSTQPQPLGEPRNSSDLLSPDAPRALRSRLNGALIEHCRTGEAVLWDLDGLAAHVGAADWHDPRLQHHAKLPFSLAATMRAADDLASVIAAATGRTRRALVLDLDNTLWGGVIGDDGLEGLVLGQGSAAGEAFLAVQRAALELRRRGIALAVCSKNDEANAREPFRHHPDMLLKEEHIAVFVANWRDKAANIRAIAEELSLGLASLAFLDDNPAEREQVRQALPEVAVIEAGDDPAHYAERLLQSGWFEHLPLTAEDRARAADYQANAERSALQARSVSYEDYLASLRMELDFRPFDAVGRARIAQLINRSNQFNLTTRRYSEADIDRFAASASHRGFQVRLKDRFADNGMICVVIVETAGRDWRIDTWLMSCRVLKRGVEEAVLNCLVSLAKEECIGRLIGEYLPTAKNAMVAAHYAGLGFAAMGEIAGAPPAEDGRGATRWSLDVSAYAARSVQMDVRIAGREDAMGA